MLMELNLFEIILGECVTFDMRISPEETQGTRFPLLLTVQVEHITSVYAYRCPRIFRRLEKFHLFGILLYLTQH